MSCRVMNRRVEHALVSYLAEQARRRGCKVLAGEYLATPKNGMVAHLYRDLGFTALDAEGRWHELPLGPAALPWPDVLARRDAVSSTEEA